MNASTAEIEEIVGYLNELKEEAGVSQRFKEKAEQAIYILSNRKELAVEKALLCLEELNALNTSPYHRTQVWDLMGRLESLKKH